MVRIIDNDVKGDGVYKVRNGNHNEKLIRMRADISGEYRRFTEDNGNRVVFVRV